MQENRLFEALLDVIPFAAYAVDIETYEIVYANKRMSENMYAPRENFCWKKLYGQNEVCSWCTISELKQRHKIYKSEKLINNFFDEGNDKWFQGYDELVRWPDGRTVKYSISVDITEQKEIQASMIKTNTKLAIQSKKLKEANQKLEYLATKDYLTGINNRGNFFKLSIDMLERSMQEGLQMYIAMLDIDHFKTLNDHFGHNTGDAALIEFSKKVNENLDESDIFGRIGGEEFALSLLSEDQEGTLKKLDALREAISQIVLTKDDNTIHFTVSIGVAAATQSDTIDTLLDRADQELYHAKNDGRNKLKFRL
ncbi:MAG: GGDEF domain-containing protein [Campylobacterales bacterium]|nr:GGDEF domain-containing protein [Campylobacterales bacterium]